MAQTGDRNDPFLAFRFEVTFDQLPPGGFSECSGLQMDIDIQEYAEGGLNTHMRKFAGRAKQSNLTLKRGVVDRSLWDWFYNLSQGSVVFRNGSIVIRDPSAGTVQMAWRITRALPAKWIGPSLNSMQSQVAVETLELVHHGLQRTT